MLSGSRCGERAIQLKVNGKVDESFEPVVETFIEGFDAGRDVGASLAVFLDGDLIVDLWAGHRDRKKTTLWDADTLCCMFSVSKAMTAICFLQAVSDGLVELDVPVGEYWPVFACNGKSGITPRQILTHQSGVVGFHDAVPRDFLYDWSNVVSALANETPWWTPGEKHGYHARTFGFLLGEILRRVSGKSVGRWLHERVMKSGPGEFKIGLNTEDITRCADMLTARVRPGAKAATSPERDEMFARFQDKNTPTGAAFQNPSLGPAYMNSTQFRTSELPAMNGHGTAVGVAGVYARVNELLDASVLSEATRIQVEGKDEVLRSFTRYGLGFMIFADQAPIGVRSGSFGHAGAGGSMAFYDPARKLAFCFAMNQMQEGVVTGGTSAMNIAQRIYDCID
jgi:CubicO group peptidase (beta-lactamase class C family)